MSRAARKTIPPYPKGKPPPPGMKRGRKGRLKRRSLVWRFRRFLLMLVLMSIVLVSGGAYVVWNGTELPQKDPPLLQTSFICAAEVTNDCNQDNSIAQLSGGVDRVTVGYDKIPALFVQALISAEDKDFFRHQGVDPAGVARALYRNLKNEKVQQGGSTITQQYVKNVYLTNEQTVTRKVSEAVLAIKLDRELPKQEILERYLNTIYFGRGAYGIEAAARVYFGKHVEQLGLPESAYLAGIIREPEGVDANRQPTDPARERQQRAATDRRKQVLDAMFSEGYITARDRDEVAAMGWDYVVPRSSATNFGKVKHAELGTEYFVDYVRHWLTSTGRFTDSQLYGGGLRVYTTLDYGAQANAYEAIRNVLDRPDDPAASIVALDDKGRVRAMVGGFDYKASQVNLAVGQEGGGSGRQPGSSFKPIVLAQYIAEGKNLGQVYNAPSKLQIKLPGENWTVANYGDAEQGQLNVVDATRKSSNTAYAQIMMDTGPASVVDLAKKMGITANLNAYPSLVLGTSEVSVLDMASAYSTFAASGEHIDPVVVTKVTNAQGQVLFDASFEKQRVLPKDTVDAVNWVLNQVVETGTGTGARVPGQTIAGKTGTTENYHDAWFAGYTCKMTAAVWVGYPSALPNGDPHNMVGVHGISVAGGTLPSTIFNRFMSKATQGLQSCAFPKPANVNDIPTGTLPVVAGTAPVTEPGTAPKGTAPPGTTAAPPSSTTTTPASTTTAPDTSSTTTPASTTTAPDATTTTVAAAPP
jgi:penicillin-binding protein 1A